jgi:hypothetical protein
MVGALSDIILGRKEPVKYADLGNPIVTVHIQGCSFPNTLADLGAAINILTMETYNTLGFDSFKPKKSCCSWWINWWFDQLAHYMIYPSPSTLGNIRWTSSSSTQEVDLKGIH